jgi:hypothetical protein
MSELRSRELYNFAASFTNCKIAASGKKKKKTHLFVKNLKENPDRGFYMVRSPRLGVLTGR